jgi:hypothetical protein
MNRVLPENDSTRYLVGSRVLRATAKDIIRYYGPRCIDGPTCVQGRLDQVTMVPATRLEIGKCSPLELRSVD